MSLINPNHVVIEPFVPEVSQRVDRFGGLLHARMGADLEVVAVASISRELHTKDTLASDVVLVAPSKKLGGLASEHAAHDELNASSLARSLAKVG